jgi:hypothetical protein
MNLITLCFTYEIIFILLSLMLSPLFFHTHFSTGVCGKLAVKNMSAHTKLRQNEGFMALSVKLFVALLHAHVLSKACKFSSSNADK